MSQEIDDLILELVDQPNNAQSDDDEGIDEYGPDLYKDEEDRRRLQALPEVERERILSERSEERQRNLERLEVRKLLNDGRREDSTRRSTRAKGSRTSGALNELARRREEKKRSTRHRRSPSPTERRKRARASYSDESAAEYTDEEEEEEDEGRVKRTPTLDEIQPIVLTRHRIERWLYAPYFEDVAIGSYVRLFIGQDEQKKHVYRLCQVVDVVPYHKKYSISTDIWSNQALKVKHGKAEKAFTMDIISNQPVTQQEYSRLLSTCEADRVPLPDLDDVKAKTKNFEAARSYVLNNEEVSQMIEKKQSISGRKVNASMEHAVLLAKLEHARNVQDHALVEKILEDLNEVKDLERSRELEVELEQKRLKEIHRQAAAKAEIRSSQWEEDSIRAKWVAEQLARRKKEEETPTGPVVGFRELYQKVAAKTDMMLLV
ncbi:hypothetical protein BDB00DRAFT_496631 [Zychaea mexicana]|uniref:uncharacterized protein n=1 Tax=Zychaea mexicana TaxID=64656 RepID=UPI0022FF1ABD|nr:uncharacterized protein BDB00DRAFT_496631 [Zychaea mexicana]KAI9498057.1 hypothetical protein BDB00DRAFT_496631 [Zychaea mexicana]